MPQVFSRQQTKHKAVLYNEQIQLDELLKKNTREMCSTILSLHCSRDFFNQTGAKLSNSKQALIQEACVKYYNQCEAPRSYKTCIIFVSKACQSGQINENLTS